MNASCIICSDLFTPRSEIYTTGCGHLFHYTCLIQWIERSKTCPQCRHRETDKTIHRLYLNFASAEGIADDVVTLQSKLDMINFQISLKDKEIAVNREKFRKCKTNCTSMREMIVEYEDKNRVHESAMLAMKYQLQNYQEKSNERDRYHQEIERLKNQLEAMDHYKHMKENCQEHVDEMLRINKDPDTLGILLTTLKKQLVDTEKEKRNISSKLTTLSRDMFKINARLEKLRAELIKIKLPPDEHDSCLTEINYLKQKISAVKTQRQSGPNCTVTSSTANANESFTLSHSDDIIDLNSPVNSTQSLPHQSLASSSSSSTRIPKRSLSQNAINNLNLKVNPNTTPLNIPKVRPRFESLTQRLKPVGQSQPEKGGFNDQSSSESKEKDHEDKKNQSSSTKRNKSSSSYTSSSKFRKIGPGSSKKPT